MLSVHILVLYIKYRYVICTYFSFIHKVSVCYPSLVNISNNYELLSYFLLVDIYSIHTHTGIIIILFYK